MMAYTDLSHVQGRTEIELYEFEEIKSNENLPGTGTLVKEKFIPQISDQTRKLKLNKRTKCLMKVLIAFFFVLAVLGATIGLEQLFGHHHGSGVFAVYSLKRLVNVWQSSQYKCRCTRSNIALNKPCMQSTVYKNDLDNTCNVANDGDFSRFMRTSKEAFPFWWVYLDTTKSVKEVVIHNRYDNHYPRLRNLNVTVGEDLFSLNQCGYYDGPVKYRGPLSIKCSSAVSGRYVQIMLMQESYELNILHVTEVEVYDCL